MQVALQNRKSAERVPKQLLDFGNGKVPVDPSTGLISLLRIIQCLDIY